MYYHDIPMSNLPHQDWEPVVLRKPEPKKKGVPPPTMSKTLTSNFDPDSITPPKTSNVSMGLAIQQGRTAKNMKQSELDSACSLAKGTTSAYESGKATYKANEVNAMARVLGITIPRPTKTKAKPDL